MEALRDGVEVFEILVHGLVERVLLGVQVEYCVQGRVGAGTIAIGVVIGGCLVVG